MKTLDGPTVKHALRMLDPFPLLNLASYRASTKRTRGLYVLSHLSKKNQKPVPVYVGMGMDIFGRLKNHVGAIFVGEFCLWDVEDEVLKDCVGLACEHKEKSSSTLYIPGTRLAEEYEYLAQRARSFLDNTQILILEDNSGADEKLLKKFEGALLQFLAGENKENGKYLLANGNRSSVSPVHFGLSNDQDSLPEFLVEYLEFSEKQG